MLLHWQVAAKAGTDVEIRFSEEKVIEICVSFLMLMILQWLMQMILLENNLKLQEKALQDPLLYLNLYLKGEISFKFH